jgi:hypothetical protein
MAEIPGKEFKVNQWPQGGFKQTSEWRKEVNSRPGWKRKQHRWEIHKDNEILKNKQNTENAGNGKFSKPNKKHRKTSQTE